MVVSGSRCYIHPNCIIFHPNKFRPLPGTEMFDLAEKEWNYKAPETVDDWVQLEVEGDYELPWMTKQQKKFIDMMLITSYFIDNKLVKFSVGNSVFYRAIL